MVSLQVQSTIKRKALYLQIHDTMFKHGRLSLNALCDIVSGDQGSIAIARNKVLREIDATPGYHK